jgi:hypothetical protein
MPDGSHLEQLLEQVWSTPQRTGCAVRCDCRTCQTDGEQALMPRRRCDHRRVDAVVDSHELAYLETLSEQHVTDADRMRLRSCEEAMLTAGDGGEWAEA